MIYSRLINVKKTRERSYNFQFFIIKISNNILIMKRFKK